MAGGARGAWQRATGEDRFRSASVRVTQNPAVPVVLAVALGILGDRWCSPTMAAWLSGTAALLLVAALCSLSRRWDRAATVATLLVWVGIGGVRHHAVWSLRGADNVSTCVREEPQPARVVVRLCSPLVLDPVDHSRSAPVWTRIDRTIGLGECRAIGPEGADIPLRGLVRLEVTGHWREVRVGDVVEAYGTLHRPSGPRNPGDFDYASFLRAQGVDALLRVEHPDHVRVIATESGWLDRFHHGRDALRRECESLFATHLPAVQVPLALSLLLGDRTRLPQEVSQQFAQSGTMHLLAISGLHVGILAGLLHLLCRLVNARPTITAMILLAGVFGYALLTDQRPPVLRAALLTAVVLSGQAAGRPAGGYQTLALCALLLLLLRPTDLFDPGAQLSFLAVWGILWSCRGETARSVARLSARERGDAWSRWPLLADVWGSSLGSAYRITGAIWLFTLPLTAWHFHLCAPVGLLVNVVLIPVTALLLAAGYVLLMAGLVHPLLATVPAVIFSTVLRGLLGIVGWSAETPLGHRFTPAPPGWWLVGFYLLLGVITSLIPSRLSMRPLWRGMAGWVALGLAWGLVPVRPGELRCTFLAVGHGCAVILETPDGRRLLYDAGSLTDGDRAAQTVSTALWSQGCRRLDGVVVSHADIDHFNGLPGLVERFPIGVVLMAPSFLDFRQAPVADVCEAIARAGIPIRLLQSGDELGLHPEVHCRVLHPPGGYRGPADNAASVVLRIEFAGRVLLLTGDLEGAGLELLLEQQPQSIDVLLSPHHGSLAANPVRLADWASPRAVIVSTSDAASSERLRERYRPPCRLFSTAADGAITVTVRANGDLNIEPFLRPGGSEALDVTRAVR